MAVNSLTLGQYHLICNYNLGRLRMASVSASATVDLPVVLHWPSGSHFQESVKIASIPDVDIPPRSWWCRETKGDVMKNGWTRYHWSDASLTGRFTLSRYCIQSYQTWLAQANHIFTRLHITSNLEDYGLVNAMHFTINFEQPTECPPPGYLFLCPSKDLQIGLSAYRWPTYPAYWTLDPNGSAPLSIEEAARLGFPSIELRTDIVMEYWDSSVYAGLRQFHQGKGFDPDSQDVARHLGLPLFQLTSDIEASSAQSEPIFFRESARQQRFDERPDFWADDEDWNLGFADPHLEARGGTHNGTSLVTQSD
ncbi:hypothetical protein DFH06DRAFT_1078885 [Mycena polygramma]|nr:hypothetical protein DFH06DRAFT_1078885 [Mycena polygramma]